MRFTIIALHLGPLQGLHARSLASSGEVPGLKVLVLAGGSENRFASG